MLLRIRKCDEAVKYSDDDDDDDDDDDGQWSLLINLMKVTQS